MGDFILTLLHASTNGHILHLRSRNYAEHKALQTYYEELPDLVDTLAEQIQGLNQELLDYDYEYYRPEETALEELQSVYQYVTQQRKGMPDNTSVQNTIDAIEELIQSTIYKLKFLK